MDELYYIIDKFSFAPRFFSAGFRKRLATDLYRARMGYNSDDYLSLCFGVSLLCFFLSLALLSIAIDYLALSILIFVIVFFSSSKYPAFKSRRLAKEMEKGMPNLLRMVGIELDMGLPFETSVYNACGDDALGLEMKRVLKQMDAGSSAPEAMEVFAERTDSSFVKRGAFQLIESYEKGGSGNSLKRLAHEQESVLRTRLKEHNGKMAVYSLLFIAISAVFPAISQAFIIVGSSFLSIGVTPLQALLIPVLVFPTANIALFIFVRLKTP